MLILYYILSFNKFLDFIDSCLSCIQFSRCILSFFEGLYPSKPNSKNSFNLYSIERR